MIIGRQVKKTWLEIDNKKQKLAYICGLYAHEEILQKINAHFNFDLYISLRFFKWEAEKKLIFLLLALKTQICHNYGKIL